MPGSEDKSSKQEEGTDRSHRYGGEVSLKSESEPENPRRPHDGSDKVLKGDVKTRKERIRIPDILMVTSTVFIALATVVNACIVKGQLDSMNDSGGDTRKLAEAAKTQATAATGQLGIMQGQLNEMQGEQRPWIYVPDITAETSGTPPIVSFKEIIRNVGKTAPRGFYIGAQTVSGDIWQITADNLCDNGRLQAKTDRKRFDQFTIVPGGEIVIEGDTEEYITTNISLDDIKFNRIKEPNVVGCIIYGSKFDDILYQSQFIGQLKFNGPNIVIKAVYTMRAN